MLGYGLWTNHCYFTLFATGGDLFLVQYFISFYCKLLIISRCYAAARIRKMFLYWFLLRCGQLCTHV